MQSCCRAETSIDSNSESSSKKILFVSHCAKMSGAEFILCDLVYRFFEDSKIFLFEDGPLRLHMEALGLQTAVGHRLDDLLEIRRDGALTVNLPFLRAMSRAVAQLIRIARRYKVIYANSQKAFVTAAIAAPLARRPLIWHLHDIMTREHFGAKQIRVAIGLANSVAERVIVPTQAVADAFCEAGGRHDKVRVIYNGISVPSDTRSLDRDTLRVELGLPRGFLICVVNRLAPWKGQHVMLQALRSVPDARCIIVGAPIFGEIAYADELHRLVEVFELRDRVRFLGHRTDVPRLMRASDIVVHTSVDPEPFSRVVVESLLSGTCVAATRAGGIPEILTGELTALLYPPGDPVALANLLRAFQSGMYPVKRLVDEGIERAERSFTVERMQREVNSVILGFLTP
jgi:glycosyltransferase involved in cell wall biosynthesis